jgi:membrane protease YdiL (CAAX protease family)
MTSKSENNFIKRNIGLFWERIFINTKKGLVSNLFSEKINFGKDSLIILSLMILSMIIPAAVTILNVYIMNDKTNIQIMYFGLKLYFIFWPLFVVAAIEKKEALLSVLFSKNQRKSIKAGLVRGTFLFFFIIGFIKISPLNSYIIDHSGFIKRRLIETGFINHFLIYGLILSVVHSLIEEYYWRWFVYGRLKRFFQNSNASFLSGLAYSAHHIVVLNIYFSFWGVVFFGILVFLAGIYWNYTYQKHESIFASWIQHLFVDLAIIYIGYHYAL